MTMKHPHQRRIVDLIFKNAFINCTHLLSFIKGNTLDSAQGNTLDSTQGNTLDSAQGNTLDSAQV